MFTIQLASSLWFHKHAQLILLNSLNCTVPYSVCHLAIVVNSVSNSTRSEDNMSFPTWSQFTVPDSLHAGEYFMVITRLRDIKVSTAAHKHVLSMI